MNNIAMYLRLSKQDETNRDESNSIQNQRKLIREYIRTHSDLKKMNLLEYKDDGFSGKLMERPGMQSLLKAVREGQIQCVIVKDFSRFSRDYIILGQYTEQIFPFLNVRFIAINDEYDSNNFEGGIGEMDVAFKSLLYDFYSEDLSTKVKTALKARRDSGKFIATTPPYGYRKKKEDRYSLEIDDYAADVVRNIFKAYLDGESMYHISKRLNDNGIDAPGIYRKKQDGKAIDSGKKNGTYWTNTAISRLLHNESYTGTLVYGKYRSKQVAKRSNQLPPEEWIRIPNVHPVIIDQKTFDQVQEKLSGNHKPKKKHPKHIMRGLIVCGGCGKVMFHTYAGRGSYYCRSGFYDKHLTNCKNSIRDEDLENVLIQLINEHTKGTLSYRGIVARQLIRYEEKLRIAEMKLHVNEKTMEQFEEDLFQSYMSYREGTIEKDTYLQQKSNIEAMQEKLQAQIEEQKAMIQTIEEQKPDDTVLNFDEATLKITELNSKLLHMLVEKIIVNPEHSLEVIWKFHN